jgi:hypothetical protein
MNIGVNDIKLSFMYKIYKYLRIFIIYTLFFIALHFFVAIDWIVLIYLLKF